MYDTGNSPLRRLRRPVAVEQSDAKERRYRAFRLTRVNRRWPVIGDVMFLMARLHLHLLGFALLFGGCAETSQPTPTGSSNTGQPVHNTLVLSEIGLPDEGKRTVAGIKVHGNSLTDNHVSAIKKASDNARPAQYEIHMIKHTGVNTVTVHWDTESGAGHHKLVFENGCWELRGGGASGNL